MIQTIAVGKKHEAWVAQGIERYEKRLKKPLDIEWVLLPHSIFEAHRARQEESERILQRIKDGDFVILLDERGKNLDSPTLSVIIDDQLSRARRVVCIIGGAYGVDDSVHARADLVWSLSKLVFPHQLVRLILTEQVYRAQEIRNGTPYHHQ